MIVVRPHLSLIVPVLVQFTMRLSLTIAGVTYAATALASCPYMSGDMNIRDSPASHPFNRRGDHEDPTEFLRQFELDDTDVFMTSDVGGPMEDQESLSVGERGPTLLEDFIFRQKITHFDHER